MRNTLLVSLLIFFGASLFSQNTFFRRYGLAVDSAFVIEPAPAGGAVLAGITSPTTGPARPWVQRLNSTGAVVWSHSWTAAEAIRPTDLLATGNGTFLMTFNNINPQASHHAGWLLFDDTGAILWSVLANGNCQLWKATPMTDGFVLVGAFRTTPNDDWQALVVRIKADGSVDWATVFGTPANEQLADVWIDAQQQIYVAGTTQVNGDADGFLARLNSAGMTAWGQRYGSAGNDAFVRIASLSTERLLLAGTSDGFGSSDEKIWLLAMTPAATNAGAIWSYAVSANGTEFATTDLAAITGNHFLVAANDPARAPGSPAVVLQIDQDAALNWVYRYDSGLAQASIEDVDVVNNGLLLAGAASGDQLAIRTGADGRISGCGPTPFNLSREAVISQAETVSIPVDADAFSADAFAITSIDESPTETNLLTPIDLAFSLSDSSICPGDCLTITLSGATPGATYTLNPSGGQPDPNQAGVVCYSDAGMFAITRTGSLGLCRDSLTIAVNVNLATDDRQVNAFTPNNDGMNDRFRPFFPCPPVGFLLNIYNRWGQLLLSTESYNNGWDGSIDGIPAPTDTYYWTAEYSTSDAPSNFTKLRGEVTLLR